MDWLHEAEAASQTGDTHLMAEVAARYPQRQRRPIPVEAARLRDMWEAHTLDSTDLETFLFERGYMHPDGKWALTSEATNLLLDAWLWRYL